MRTQLVGESQEAPFEKRLNFVIHSLKKVGKKGEKDA